MLLEIDIGNTRLKWRLRDNQQTLDSRWFPTALVLEHDNLNELFAGANLHDVTSVHVASVVSACQSRFVQWCKAATGCQPVFAVVTKKHSGVTNAYNDVSQMGVDRWLALLSAHALCAQPCLVIDAGSAITMDLLQVDGQHLGGYILPGLQLMNNTLRRKTDSVNMSEQITYPVTLSAGQSTDEAVLSGLPLMVLGATKMAWDELMDNGRANIIVTGGDGPYLQRLLRNNGFAAVECVADLVLDGLALCLDKQS